MEECNFKKPLCLMTGVSLVLQLIGFVTPYWFVLAQPAATVNFGLWYSVQCPTTDDNSDCHIEPISSSTHSEQEAALVTDFLEYQIEACLALILCAAGTVLMFIVLRTEAQLKVQRFMIAVLVCDLFSGVCALIASGKMADNVRQAHVMMGMFMTNSAFGFPYSLVLTGIGGILLISACIIYVFRKQCGQPSSEADQSRHSYRSPPPSYPWTTSQPMNDGVTGQQYEPVPNEPQPHSEQELSTVEAKEHSDPPPRYDV